MEAIPLEWTPERDARLRGEEIEETLKRWLGIARAFNEERRSMAEVTTMRHEDKKDMGDIRSDECPSISLDDLNGITWTAHDTDWDGTDDSTHMFLPWDVLDGTLTVDEWIQEWVRKSYEKLQEHEAAEHERAMARQKATYLRLKALFEGGLGE